MRWSHSGKWMVTTDDRGLAKYWQPNFNNVHTFQAHNEAVRATRWDSYSAASLVLQGYVVYSCCVSDTMKLSVCVLIVTTYLCTDMLLFTMSERALNHFETTCFKCFKVCTDILLLTIGERVVDLSPMSL